MHTSPFAAAAALALVGAAFAQGVAPPDTPAPAQSTSGAAPNGSATSISNGARGASEMTSYGAIGVVQTRGPSPTGFNPNSSILQSLPSYMAPFRPSTATGSATSGNVGGSSPD